MTAHTPDPNSGLDSGHVTSRYGRRDALKLGGLGLSFAALVAACGNDRGGGTAPGRVGYAPPVTDPPEYAIDDAVYLRTASSLELTLVAAYEAILETGALDAEVTTLVERLITDHQTIADDMGGLTEAVGGVAWACTNPWYMDRLVTPLLAAVIGSDNPPRDIVNSAVALENLGAATHQSLTLELQDPDGAAATMAAATLESRHSAAIVSAARGAEGYVSTAIAGGEVPTDADGVTLQFAITDRFGSTGQIELIAGPPNENGVRQTFVFQTPSLNSWIYNELEPTC